MDILPNIVIAIFCSAIVLERSMKGNRSVSESGVFWVIIIISLMDALMFFLGTGITR